MLILALFTYILATIFAIAGMGAAGVLIPNYISLGMSVRTAMLMALTQNTAELSVATGLNHLKKLIKWKNVFKVLFPAIILVPLGAYVNIHIPRILVLVSFDLFLLFALYRMLVPAKLEYTDTYTIPILGALEGFIAGLIGMDAAPIAIIAFAYMFENSKEISSNTAATALGVSFTTLIVYLLLFPKIAIDPNLLIVVAFAGFLGGITGVLLMHRIQRKYVRYTILGILALALVEILVKISLAKAGSLLYWGSILILSIALGIFVFSIILKKMRIEKLESH